MVGVRIRVMVMVMVMDKVRARVRVRVRARVRVRVRVQDGAYGGGLEVELDRVPAHVQEAQCRVSDRCLPV